MGSYFDFKTNKDAKKIKVSISDIQSLVVKADTIGLDSFVVANIKTYSKKTRDSVSAKKLRQVVYNTPLKLYVELVLKGGPPAMMSNGIMMNNGIIMNHGTMMGGNNRIETIFYYGHNPDTVIKLTNKNFIPVMSEILADKPAIVKLIQRKKLTLYRIEEIIQFTKTGHSPINTTGY